MHSFLRKVNTRTTRALLASLLALGAYTLLVKELSSLPLESMAFAMDWKGMWQAMQGGKIRYGPSLRNPPWSLLPVLPLGFFPFVESWALLSVGTLVVMVKSVPRTSKRWLYVLGVVLLIASYPSVRHLVDGNVEGIVLAGLLLVLFGYRAHHPIAFACGLLLASAKPQETWLVLPIAVGMTLRHWPKRAVVHYSAVVALVTLPLLAIYNDEWLHVVVSIEQRGSLMDSSLTATTTRLALPGAIIAVLWGGLLALTLYLSYTLRDSEFSSLQAGFLVAAALLLAPYAAGNSLLIVVALGMIPLFLESPKLGLLLLGGTDAQYLFSASFRYHMSATYITALLLLSWGVLGVYLRRHPPAPVPQAQEELGALPPNPRKGRSAP